MTNLEGDVYNGTIPAFPYCTNVYYQIIAEDNCGNIAITEAESYHVVPEFSAHIVLPLLALSTLAVLAIRKRKLFKKAKL